MTLLELAERCEAATGSDRRLDAEIACATAHKHLRPAEPTDFGGKYGCQAGDLKVETGFLMSHRYTRSLDDAMELIPSGWFLQGLSERNASGTHNWRWKAELWSPENDVNVRGIARQAHADKCAPALAICAAALRVRAAIAAGTQRAETGETPAPSEGCQSGGEAASPNTSIAQESDR